MGRLSPEVERACAFCGTVPFDTNAAMTDHAERLAALRAHLATLDLTGFVVPLTDEYMSEYVGSYARKSSELVPFAAPFPLIRTRP